MPGQGQCACGGVRYRTDAELRAVLNCHCHRCRRSTGHFLAATGCPRSTLEIDDPDAVRWYEAATGVFYGFCPVCGSTLFWRTDADDDWIAIAAGTLDQPTGLTTVGAWWTAEAADYHQLDTTIINHAYESGGSGDSA